MYSDCDYVDLNSSSKVYTNSINVEHSNKKTDDEWVTFAPALQVKMHLHNVLTCANQSPLIVERLSDEVLLEKAKADNNLALIEVINKYHKNGRYENALYNAIDKEDFAAAEMIIQNGGKVEYGTEADFAAVTSDYKFGIVPALALAISKPNVTCDFIEQLIKAGAELKYNPGVRNIGQWKLDGAWPAPALSVAARYQRVDIMKLLIDSGANVNEVYSFSFTFQATPLSYICFGFFEKPWPVASEKKLEMMRCLLENGANPSLCDALGYAIQDRSRDAVKLLFDYNVDVNKMQHVGYWQNHWWDGHPVNSFYELAKSMNIGVDLFDPQNKRLSRF